MRRSHVTVAALLALLLVAQVVAAQSVMDGLPWWNRAANYFINFFGAHPWLVWVVLAALLMDNALRTRYRDLKAAPGWVIYVLGFIGPVVGNIWPLLRKLGIGRGDDPPPSMGLGAP